ncbi:MAG: hypothetical protein AAFP26_06790 [Planctomycetota bacterium]
MLAQAGLPTWDLFARIFFGAACFGDGPAALIILWTMTRKIRRPTWTKDHTGLNTTDSTTAEATSERHR